MFLTRDEIAELTGRRRKDAQLAALRMMGIEHLRRPDGSIAVLRSHVVKTLGGTEETGNTRRQEAEPRWDLCNA